MIYVLVKLPFMNFVFFLPIPSFTMRGSDNGKSQLWLVLYQMKYISLPFHLGE